MYRKQTLRTYKFSLLASFSLSTKMYVTPKENNWYNKPLITGSMMELANRQFKLENI